MNKILFVDDEVEAIESFRVWLEPKYEMIIAKDSAAALETLNKHKDQISVAVIDMKLEKGDNELMPDSGLKLIRKIKKIDNSIQVIIFTGYPDNPYLRNCIEAGAMIYVIKGLKYTRDLLTAFIEQAFVTAQNLKNHLSLTSKYSSLSKEYTLLSDSIKDEIKVGKWFGKENISIDLEKVICIEKDLTVDSEWKTISEVSIGETVELSQTIEVEQANLIEQKIGTTIKEMLNAELSLLILKKLENKLSMHIDKVKKISESKKIRSTKSVKKILSVPEPQNYSEKYVTKRSYQSTGKYDKYFLELNIFCSACKIEKQISLNLYVPTGKVATRVITCFNNREIEISEL